MIKKGFKHDKQRYQGKECNHVFTYNSHTITMYSKIERSMFHKIVLDMLNCVAIKTTAADLDVSIQCVFENRHKLLCALEQLLNMEHMKLSGTIEFDETFELESQKGNSIYREEPLMQDGKPVITETLFTPTEHNGTVHY